MSERLGEYKLQNIRTLERRIFPVFDATDTTAPPHGNYLYFSPSYLLRRGILDAKGLTDVTTGGKTLLSVGAGKAFLERTLVELGANRENIVLSDVDPSVLPVDYNSQVFDMTNPWPNLYRQFDYVIFPESLVGISAKHDFNRESKPYRRDLATCLTSAYTVLNPGGEIRAVSWFYPPEREFIRSAFARRNATVESNSFELVVIKSLPVS